MNGAGMSNVLTKINNGGRKENNNFQDMFPMAYTGVSVMLFMVPCFTLIYIMRQPAVNYLVNDGNVQQSLLVLVPIVIVLSYFYHAKFGPNKYVTGLGLLIPAILLLVEGMAVQSQSVSFVQSLASIDCDILPQKAHLQLEWEAAHAFFQKCTKDTAATTNYTSEFLMKNFRIQDCNEYAKVQAAHASTWGYLQSLEENYACTGFCVPGAQLWFKGPHQDSCSVAVSMIFDVFVSARANKVVLVMLGVVVLSAVLFAIVGPLLKEHSAASW